MIGTPADSDDCDEEEVWESMCKLVAKNCGVSVEWAKAVLDAAGFHAFGHTGILDAMNVVRNSMGLPELKGDSQ